MSNPAGTSTRSRSSLRRCIVSFLFFWGLEYVVSAPCVSRFD
ncbi:hypothetical protein Patl1_06632 [Pistacia atlantica]|uniref:Uncharacterized protein n=1 Tax=Pistacia atlantica TaxID=434234 RepID=A0ACC1BTC9_9ROSI|nr:hypothetical protein Patl1_06632 [Pistacia atlantica]